jgi:hypothetical protein
MPRAPGSFLLSADNDALKCCNSVGEGIPRHHVPGAAVPMPPGTPQSGEPSRSMPRGWALLRG